VRWLFALGAGAALLIGVVRPARAQGYDTSGAPEELPYRAGDAIPLGYHLERTARETYIEAGIVAFGIGYASAIAVGASDGFENKKGYVLIPLVGPLFTINSRDRRNDSASQSGFVFFETVIDLALQATGAGAVLLEEVRPKTRLVRDTALRLSVSPQLARDFVGLSLTGEL
jgi:hypothetical protein